MLVVLSISEERSDLSLEVEIRLVEVGVEFARKAGGISGFVNIHRLLGVIDLTPGALLYSALPSPHPPQVWPIQHDLHDPPSRPHHLVYRSCGPAL